MKNPNMGGLMVHLLCQNSDIQIRNSLQNIDNSTWNPKYTFIF